MSFRILDQRPVYLDSNGVPCAGGTLSTYTTGTLTPLDSYADPGLSVNNGPIVALDSAGRTAVDIWSTGVIRVIVRDVNGVTVFDSDNTKSSSEIPDVSGQNGLFLTNNGTSLLWAAISQVPDVTGEAGKVLGTDGASYYWTTPSSTGDQAGGTISNVVFKNARETCQVLTALATLTIDWRLGGVVLLNQAVDCVLSFTGLPAAGEATILTLIRAKDATATSRALTYGATVKLPGGTPVPFTQTTGGLDVVAFLAYNGVAIPLLSYNTAFA